MLRGAIDALAASDIELAYGITCHKAQGSSARTVIVVVEGLKAGDA